MLTIDAVAGNPIVNLDRDALKVVTVDGERRQVLEFALADGAQAKDRKSNKWHDVPDNLVNVTIWDENAIVNILASGLTTKQRLIVTGDFYHTTFVGRDGERRFGIAVSNAEVGLSLRWTRVNGTFEKGTGQTLAPVAATNGTASDLGAAPRPDEIETLQTWLRANQVSREQFSADMAGIMTRFRSQGTLDALFPEEDANTVADTVFAQPGQIATPTEEEVAASHAEAAGDPAPTTDESAEVGTPANADFDGVM